MCVCVNVTNVDGTVCQRATSSACWVDGWERAATPTSSAAPCAASTPSTATHPQGRALPSTAETRRVSIKGCFHSERATGRGTRHGLRALCSVLSACKGTLPDRPRDAAGSEGRRERQLGVFEWACVSLEALAGDLHSATLAEALHEGVHTQGHTATRGKVFGDSGVWRKQGARGPRRRGRRLPSESSEALFPHRPAPLLLCTARSGTQAPS